MEYIRMGRIDEFPENTCRLLSLPDGAPVLVINLEGDFYAIEGYCSSGHPLDDAVVDAEAGKVLCPSHGWELDVEAGVCLAEPECQLKKYPVRIEGEEVQIGSD